MATIGDESGTYPIALRNRGVSKGHASVLDVVGVGLNVAVNSITGDVATLTIANPVSLAVATNKPTAAHYETYSRLYADTANAAALASGTLLLVTIALPKDEVVTNIVFVSGTQAAVAPTHQWFGLFDAAGVALAFTADDTSTAWGASSAKSLALSAPYTIPATGLYQLGIMVSVTTTAPSLLCKVYGVSTIANLAPILQGAADTGQTTVPALPFTAAALTVGVNRPYAYTN